MRILRRSGVPSDIEQLTLAGGTPTLHFGAAAPFEKNGRDGSPSRPIFAAEPPWYRRRRCAPAAWAPSERLQLERGIGAERAMDAAGFAGAPRARHGKIPPAFGRILPIAPRGARRCAFRGVGYKPEAQGRTRSPGPCDSSSMTFPHHRLTRPGRPCPLLSVGVPHGVPPTGV